MNKEEEIKKYLISMGCSEISAQEEVDLYKEKGQIDEVYFSIFENY